MSATHVNFDARQAVKFQLHAIIRVSNPPGDSDFKIWLKGLSMVPPPQPGELPLHEEAFTNHCHGWSSFEHPLSMERFAVTPCNEYL